MHRERLSLVDPAERNTHCITLQCDSLQPLQCDSLRRVDFEVTSEVLVAYAEFVDKLIASGYCSSRFIVTLHPGQPLGLPRVILWRANLARLA